MRSILPIFIGVLLIMSIASPLSATTVFAEAQQGRVIDPIVSTDWLSKNLNLSGLVIIDIRSPDEYSAGHIPGSINIPAELWYINPPFGERTPWMELPPDNQLLKLLSDNGITSDSLVVIVGSTSGPLAPLPIALYNTATACRVAITLLYAGVTNVAILDGGYDKWVAEKRPVTTEPTVPKSVTYTGAIRKGMVVSKDYVVAKIGKATIIDARDLIVYLGFVQEPWTARAGHIPTARSLPTPWLYSIKMGEDGMAVYTTFMDVDFMRTLATNIIGGDKDQEIIVYCGIGGYASTTYFVLKEVLGYKNVVIYDGSAQEWTYDLSLPVVYEGLGHEYMGLQKLYKDLSAAVSSLQIEYTKLQGDYYALRGELSKLRDENQQLKTMKAELEARLALMTPMYLTLIFVATTIVFIVLTVYLAIKLRSSKKL
ncbi:MAG: rhodanese-like domain-containing protein [Candidatus Nezhaarchaeales archaeon]